MLRETDHARQNLREAEGQPIAPPSHIRARRQLYEQAATVSQDPIQHGKLTNSVVMTLQETAFRNHRTRGATSPTPSHENSVVPVAATTTSALSLEAIEQLKAERAERRRQRSQLTPTIGIGRAPDAAPVAANPLPMPVRLPKPQTEMAESALQA